MKKTELNEEEHLLEFLLKNYYRPNEDFPDIIVFKKIEPAVESFIDFFKNEDSINNTNHIEIIKKIFVDNEISNKNCTDIGLSISSFYRYKRRYLQTFKIFLSNLP